MKGGETVLAGRFELEQVAGQGGMGTVFRARDRETARLVAVKVVEPTFANARFEREAQLLAQLEDETIVRYVAHGSLEGGRMYLAMEWLEGEPLDIRLERGPLPLDECLDITARLTRALAAAHARGIVHRDVKPANVILEHGAPNRARLVDFGIARIGNTRQAMTATGAVIGTPAYMAPEQARGLRVEPPADIFSLGCVVFECLCGRPAFAGEHAIAILAKILLEAPPAPNTLRPDVPPWLDAVVMRMLEKEPAARFVDAGVLQRALEERSAPPTRTTTIGTVESHMATVVLAKLAADHGLEEALAPTEDASGGRTARDVFTEIGVRFGITMAALTNGSIVGVATTREGAGDAAERAARCALEIAAQSPVATVVLATGRAVVGVALPVGSAIDAAAALLSAVDRPPGVYLDDPTATLLEPRFAMTRDPERGTIALRSEGRARGGVVHAPSPCVGRDRELGMLEATFGECVDEPVAQGLLLVAAPGIGKSRLWRELVDRVQERKPNTTVWLGLADPLMVDAPFALVGDVLRRELGILDDEPLSTRREKVLARVPDRRAAVFIGEVAGAPFDEADEPALRAARNNPGLLASQLSEALVALALGRLASGPLLVVLEDLHWADAASLGLFGGLVQACADRPLMLLGLARPSVDETHPRLWTDLRCQRIALQPLLKKAAIRIARALVGEDADVEAIVERAEGNAFFVEELARARLAGRSELPPTIAAATEARLLALAPDLRLVLRAGAVFGERFWRGGVVRLVGTNPAVDPHLETLERMEIVTRSPASRFAGEIELVFRHALLRDAAYAMLTEADRKIAHAAAGEWLETRIDDAVLLAHHYDDGDRPEDAARWLAQAAEDAVDAGDLDSAVRHANRATELGAAGEVAGRADLVRAHVHLWRSENVEAHQFAARATGTLGRGGRPFFEALGIAVAAAGKRDEALAVDTWTRMIEETPATDEATGRARAIALARAAMQLFYLEPPDRADALVAAAEAERGVAGDAVVYGWLLDTRLERSFAQGYALHPSLFDEGIAKYRRLGDRRAALMAVASQCVALGSLGAIDETMELARRTREDAKESGPILIFVETMFDAQLRAERGDYEKLAALIHQLAPRTPRFAGAQAIMLSAHQFFCGDVELAERQVELALRLTEKTPAFHALSLAQAARLALHRGDVDRAVAWSDASVASSRFGIGFPYRYLFDVSRSEVLEHVGDPAGAREVLAQALVSVRKNAEIAAEYRGGFLQRRTDVRLLLARARAGGLAIDDLG